MNKSTLFGFFVVAAVIYISVYESSKNPQIFLHVNSIILIVGGTLAVSMIAFPFTALMKTVDYVLWGLLFKKNREYLKASQDIAGARSSFQVNQNYNASEDGHPFMKEAIVLLLNRNIDNHALEQVLRQRSDYFRKKYGDDAKVLYALSKYPPAFGVMGSAIAMIEMLNSMSNGGVVNIGHTMTLATVAAFWGIAIANFIILPLADSATKAVDDDHMLRSLIIDGMVLIRERATDDHFQAYMRSYLSLTDRSEFKIYSKKYPNNNGGIGVDQVRGEGTWVGKPKEETQIRADQYYQPNENSQVLQFGREPQGNNTQVNVQPQNFNQQQYANFQNTQVSNSQANYPGPQHVQPQMVWDPSIQAMRPVDNKGPEHDPLAFEQFKASIRESGQKGNLQQQPNNETNLTQMPVKMVVGSEIQHEGAQPPDPSQYTATRVKPEHPGRVEQSIPIDPNAEANPEEFKFKDLRREMKKSSKK